MSHSILAPEQLQLFIPTTKEIPLTQGKVATVDASDYDWLMQWKWHAWKDPRKQTWYARCSVTVSTGNYQVVAMHRLILDAARGILVDHIDLDGLNNTRLNLRLASNQQNLGNRGIARSNTSGFKGVIWNKRVNKWQAQITTNYKCKYLGVFSDIEDAARAYDKAAIEFFGDFAKLNFPQEK